MTAGPLPLAEVADADVYGAKAVSLGVAARAGLPVPAGTALPADLVARAAEDAAARAVVRDAAAALGGPLAVRSSAVGEDGARSSFAGQHLTVLNVADPGEAVAAVLRVAGSACAPSALAYRQARGDPGAAGCGVVLQCLVTPTVAGVLFSRDPVTGADQLVVEASWALGEAVVEGLVTPDLFRLDPDGRLLESVVGVKDRAVVPRPGGGTATVAVDGGRARRPCLTDADLAALADLAHRCDALFGDPSDVEWAIPGGAPVLLQRRPITTLV
ncbi:Pyruvate phosphate dikinase, PEP/pyruvate binding domain [Geodermatophilus telluris]|uniref:Pyruvate phosphate dikinase, PEP/pyruvate binding domain n=1 Tax=Geodermatophilus telluris TaxID=1190417 RepID=A0A1G6JC52_9ACTN|nr:PEP/pyruvate-binding domain-containing protein [Geodermatophilus telluris]SDC16318.1 Pyruvate phosphate dikinase, PEP/pyruvate binding domain [Geodermatophilus telluris]